MTHEKPVFLFSIKGWKMHLIGYPAPFSSNMLFEPQIQPQILTNHIRFSPAVTNLMPKAKKIKVSDTDRNVNSKVVSVGNHDTSTNDDIDYGIPLSANKNISEITIDYNKSKNNGIGEILIPRSKKQEKKKSFLIMIL